MTAGSQAQFTGLQDLLWSVKTALHEIRRFLTSRNHRGNTIETMEVQYTFDCRMPHSASQRHIQQAVCYVRNHMCLLVVSRGVSEVISSMQASLYNDCELTGTGGCERPAADHSEAPKLLISFAVLLVWPDQHHWNTTPCMCSGRRSTEHSWVQCKHPLKLMTGSRGVSKHCHFCMAESAPLQYEAVPV